MTKLPDLGPYTTDETRQIAIEALVNLSLSDRVKAVLEAFNKDDGERDELMTWLEKEED